MKAAGFRIVSLVHELPQLIRNERLEQRRGRDRAHCRRCGVSQQISWATASSRSPGRFSGRIAIRPQGLYRAEVIPDSAARKLVRAELGLPVDARIVLNVGYGDLRKGFDLFIEAADVMAKRHPDVHFVWVGRVPQHASDIDARHGPKARGARGVIACGHRENVADYYAAADAFFLSSREDPYPSVVLEAMATAFRWSRSPEQQDARR
jgi:glycosyltransferase involved in cell wall biosynthesis